MWVCGNAATAGTPDSAVQQPADGFQGNNNNNHRTLIAEEDQRSIVAAFEKWDLKRNGYISESELKHVLNALGIDSSQVRAMFKDVDRNRDGKIDYQEFVRWLYGSAPVAVRRTALAPSFSLHVRGIFLELEDDPSFAGWWSDASSIRPFVRWRDLFTGKVLCESSEGQGLRSRISTDGLPLLFDILDEGHQAVCVEVCLARTLRSSRVLGVGRLTLAEVSAGIAQGLGQADNVVVQLQTEQPRAETNAVEPNSNVVRPIAATSVEGNMVPVQPNGHAAVQPGAPLGVQGRVVQVQPNSNAVEPNNGQFNASAGAKPPVAGRRSPPPVKKTLVGKVVLDLSESPAHDRRWAKRKVEVWQRNGLPPLGGLSEVNEVLLALTVAPERNLEFSVLEAAEALALRQVDNYARMQPDNAKAELDSLEQWLGKLEETAKRSDEVHRRAAARLEKTGDRVASAVLSESLRGQDHQLMRHALSFASRVDPHVPEMQEVERKFKLLLSFSASIKLSDLLMASEADVVRAEPADFGLELATDGKSLARVEERVRYAVRDETAQRVLAMLGCKTKLHFSRGNSYERLAMDTISGKDFAVPGPLSALLAKTMVFPGEAPATKRSVFAAIASRRRDLEALLGRFDVLASPARAEYDANFKALPSNPFFGHSARELAGGSGWFWVLHAAAINIGENAQAADFRDYSMPADVGYRGRRGYSRWVDEDRYIADMGTLWRRALQAAVHLGVEDMITFPFGMGAFLRNLHQLDGRYTDPAALRRLKLRVAQGLFEAAAEVCVPNSMRLHLCLVDGGLEARMNHNVFVESAGAKIKEVPELGRLFRIHRNCDALELAHRLASGAHASRGDVDDEVRKVALLNGANNKLLGNHWFSNGARSAIDENLHRRSGAMCAASLLLNMSTASLQRSFQELVTNVEMLGGKAVELLPYPPPAKYVRTASRILAQVAVVPFSVLGTQMSRSRQMQKKGREPDANTVIVDPAGLPYIRSGPSGAGGASGTIYNWLGIRDDHAFPDEVRAAITAPLQAKFHTYGRKSVVHVVGPNFQGRADCSVDDALDELSEAYAATLAEFAACGRPRLRLLPISSSIFAGPFAKDMPELTARALQRGFELLGAGEQDRVLAADQLEMCIFSEAEHPSFEEAFRAA